MLARAWSAGIQISILVEIPDGGREWDKPDSEVRRARESAETVPQKDVHDVVKIRDDHEVLVRIGEIADRLPGAFDEQRVAELERRVGRQLRRPAERAEHDPTGIQR